MVSRFNRVRGVGSLFSGVTLKGVLLALVASVGLAFADGSSAPVMPPHPVEAAEAPSFLTTAALQQLPPPLQETKKIRPTGVLREFTLVLERGMTELVSGTMTEAITINGQAPGPTIRVMEGDTVRITVHNQLDEPTAIHWHGLHLPYKMDGVAPGTMLPIKPGADYVYEFTASHAGTFMYHAHGLANEIEQVDRGLYGAFIIDPQGEGAEPHYDVEQTMVLGGWVVMPPEQHAADGTMTPSEPAEPTGMQMAYNYWTINGKSFPDIEPIRVKEGDRVRIRLINISNLVHPMHLHGTDFRVIAEDGHPVAAPQIMNTIAVDAGKTFDIEFIADNPGVWVFHCHELHHTTNNDVAPGGLIQLIQYEGYEPIGLPELLQGTGGMEGMMPGAPVTTPSQPAVPPSQPVTPPSQPVTPPKGSMPGMGH